MNFKWAWGQISRKGAQSVFGFQRQGQIYCSWFHQYKEVLTPGKTMFNYKELSSEKIFNGYQKVFSHQSDQLGCTMKFAAFIPNLGPTEQIPMLFYLSGLSCTEQNVITKSGYQKYAADHKIIVICPDTSPRGCNIEGEENSYDFGTGAGFYLDATTTKWKTNYRMQSYLIKELLEQLPVFFKDIYNGCVSIMGHSMGGHGALICALKNPGMFASVSALAPVCNPMKCPWGKKAFQGYLGDDKESWKEYDACELLQKYEGPPMPVLVDQGMADSFLKDEQLLPENLEELAAKQSQISVTMRRHEGYSHSYYFIATFIEDHISFHAEHLKKCVN